MSKRKTLAIVAAVAAFAAVSASAAGLGGLTGQSLGAETSVVAGCDSNGVTVGYTTGYSALPKEYTVSNVTLSGIDATAAGCLGKTASLTLAFTAASGITPLTVTGVVPAAGSLTFAVPNLSAAAVSNVAVVIS